MNSLDDEFLTHLTTLDTEIGLRELDSAGLSTLDSATHLALSALNSAEIDGSRAAHTLQLATALAQRLGNPASLRGQIDYAQARIYLQQGNPSLAEIALRAAQSAWTEIDDKPALARSRLGLTQILTLQGRYSEAEQTCRLAISELQPLAAQDTMMSVPLIMAQNNLVTQLVYQERHQEAVIQGQSTLQQIGSLLTDSSLAEEVSAQLHYWQGAVGVNRATSLMALDQPNEAESQLVAAIVNLQQVGDLLSLGKAQSNLGSLFARTGRYAEALRYFDIASQLLLGDDASPDAADLARSELLLDQATTYLALNLLAEAGAALERCEQLYRNADQPYELAQSLLLHGLVRCRLQDYAGAQRLFDEAQRLFSGLNNRLWQNRIELALAVVEMQLDDPSAASARLDALLAEPLAGSEVNVLHLDIATLTEARLLRLHIHLQRGEIDSARTLAQQVASDLEKIPLAHFELRLHHAWGQIEAASGNAASAQAYFEQAIELLESQRLTLPVEEIRTAFLTDKSAIYADLVIVLLNTTHSQAVDEAFAVVERARSRALLERLLTALSSAEMQGDSALQTRRAVLQQQLHWLYNRLLNDPGSRRIDATIDDDIRNRELALQQLEWQQSPNLLVAEPVSLSMLQASLAVDQQALTFFMAGDEVMLFVVARQGVQLSRNLCSVHDLTRAHKEWQFQLGRAEMSPDYMQRHAQRFEHGWRTALQQLYCLLIAPIRDRLSCSKLLIIPYGVLHLLPFHAMWDGEHFLLEHYEITYAPSASLAVQIAKASTTGRRYETLAALAITDPAIPAARHEVEAAACYFAESRLFIDEQATLSALQASASSADVLHLATHGLFRPDNAFFSALKLADGWVDVRQLYRLPLAAHLVVLSACESGTGQVHGGDEVVGLARGFLGAGADAVVASLWNVHDASSARIMAAFYRFLKKGATPTAALRFAQMEAITEVKHPYYWAPYFVIGC